MSLPTFVTLVEVGPRDGLQNEPVTLSVLDRVALIDRLSDSGLRSIEVGSFVSPKRLPQMADTDKVLAQINRRPNVRYSVLVPNTTGVRAAISAGARDIAIFTAASETFSQRNTNCSIAESLERFASVCMMARDNDIRVRGYISCVLGCPYEGFVDIDRVALLARQLIELGCCEISLGDTIGIGTPGEAQTLVKAVAERVPIDQVAVHFHDTNGQALSNILAAMELGIAVVDSAVAGLGGCPFSPGATGNVATEDVLEMLSSLGVETGVDLDAVVEVGHFIRSRIGRHH